MIARRRFLQVVAAATVPGLWARAEAADWRGTALGADVSLRVTGAGAEAAVSDLPALLRRVEETFSLYAPSELQGINLAGEGMPSLWMSQALRICDQMHGLSVGLFDPTVQPLWRALAEGGDLEQAAAKVGWAQVRLGDEGVRLGRGQALTLNGMAQGFAADLVRDWLTERGFDQALVNMGETAALGGPYRIGLEDLGDVTLRGTALAVSVPGAMVVGGRSHILHPSGGAPRWAMVAVEADRAALADALSTAMVLADEGQVRAMQARAPGVRRVWLGDVGGGVATL